MANQILAGAVINAGMVIAGVDASNPPYVGPPVSLPKNPLFILSQDDDTPEDGSINAGSVYVYNLDNLTEEPIIKRPITDGTATYGTSAYRSSEYLFIGARYLNEVYVYDVDDSNTPIMTLSSPTENIQFGKSLSGDENILVVGSGSASNGFAYVYDMNDLSNDPIELSAPASGIYFGENCLVLPSYIVVSHRGYNTTNYTSTGAFWVYDRNDLSASPTLVENPAGSFMYGQFAQSLSLSEDGSKFVVGSAKGSIYVYDSNNPSSAPVSEFLLTDELKDTTSGGTDPDNSSTINALSETHFVTGFTNWSGYDNNGDPMSVGKIYIWPADDPSATPTTLSGFDVGITQDGLGVPAWSPRFGAAVELVDDKLIVASNEGTSEMPDRPGTVRVFDINDLSSPLATFTQPYSEYVAHDLFGNGIYAPGLAPERAPAPEPTPQNYYQASLSDWTIVAGSVSEPTSGTFAWTREGGSGWVAGYEVSGLTVGTEYTISYEMRKTGGPGPVEMRITPAVGGGATLTNHITESSDFVTFTSTWTQPDQTTAYVNIISDNGGGSGEIKSVSIVGPIPNEPPVISGIDASYTLTEGQDTVVTAVGTDPESDAITWSYNIAESISASDFTLTGMYNNNLGTSANGLTLTIDGGGSSWVSYQNLPTYLTGLLCTTGINEGESLSFTIPACTVYMLRVPNWDGVDTTGWTEVESGQSYLTDYSGMTVYSKEFSAGTYNFDNQSAMYMFASETIDMTVSQTDNVFTITPGTTDISTQVTFTATDSAGNSTSVSSDITFAAPAPALSANWVVVGVPSDNGETGSAYVYDATDLSATPTKLTAFDGIGNDKFGYSVSATADKVVVGSFYDDDNGLNSGSVYVYDANNLSATPTKLTAFDGTQHDNFGQSVAATADKIVVGAPNDDEGSAYVYDATDLSATPTKLKAYDGAVYDQFAQSVAVAATSDKIVVGAYGDDDNGRNTGSIYVYDANDLSATPTKLTAFDAAADDQFAQSVAATADKIVVGAKDDDDNGSNSGSVYVFDANDLSATPTKLTAFDGAANDMFGNSVAATSDKIVVGAHGDDDNGSGSGSVYVYDANDLSAQPTKLTAFDAAFADSFGISVSAINDKIIVGAPYDDDDGDMSGSVYVYDANDLSATPTKLTAFDGGEYDMFGKVVAIG